MQLPVCETLTNIVTSVIIYMLSKIIPRKCYYTINGDHAAKVHLFPFRTQKLSFAGSKVLAWRHAGRIEHCRFSKETSPQKVMFFYCLKILLTFAQNKQKMAMFGKYYAKITLFSTILRFLAVQRGLLFLLQIFYKVGCRRQFD